MHGQLGIDLSNKKVICRNRNYRRRETTGFAKGKPDVFGESGEDEEFAKDLIEHVGVKAEVKYTTRIGNERTDDRSKLLLVPVINIQNLVNQGNSRYRRNQCH